MMEHYKTVMASRAMSEQLRGSICCCQVVWGGRDESQYFDDVWAFDVHAREWEEWGLDSPIKPSARNHLGGFLSNDTFYISGVPLLLELHSST